MSHEEESYRLFREVKTGSKNGGKEGLQSVVKRLNQTRGCVLLGRRYSLRKKIHLDTFL